MEKANYKQIYQKLTNGLSPKTKDVLNRRFGVKTGTPETLESIGKTFGITRERVRQIEEVGFNYIRKQNKEVLDAVYVDFVRYFEEKGGIKKEEIALEELGGKNQKPYVLFLLTIGDQFSRICEKKDFYYFWSTLPEAKIEVKKNLDAMVSDIKKIGKPVSKEEFYGEISSKRGFPQLATLSYLEISKRIQENKEGKLGLIDWPEIKPRGVRDRAFLVFKKHQKPLHFTEVATLIDKLEYNLPNLTVGRQGKKTYPQTVHNELIKDSRFVLVGRGTYALAEWGYAPGTIKDVITGLLEKKQEPIHRDEIVKEVLSQRLVAKNTVLMNLNNKKYFEKDAQDNYFLKGVQQN